MNLNLKFSVNLTYFLFSPQFLIVICLLSVNFAFFIKKLKFINLASQSLAIMQDSYIEINSVPTHVYTWGHHVNEELKNEKIDKLVLIITGRLIK